VYVHASCRKALTRLHDVKKLSSKPNRSPNFDLCDLLQGPLLGSLCASYDVCCVLGRIFSRCSGILADYVACCYLIILLNV